MWVSKRNPNNQSKPIAGVKFCSISPTVPVFQQVIVMNQFVLLLLLGLFIYGLTAEGINKQSGMLSDVSQKNLGGALS